MGQYWLPVNLDKKEFLDPHMLGSGLKLWEQLANTPGTPAALLVLCAAMPEARGGGDLERSYPEADRVIGRWAGDRIALVGDYAEDDDLPVEPAGCIYDLCRKGVYRDITSDVCRVIEHELGGEFTGTGWREWKENN